MDHKTLKNTYRSSNEGVLIIDVSLDDYNDIFNDWDPAPFKKRDIDQELKIFLEDCSADIPLKHKLDIEFFLPKKKKDLEREESAIIGLRNYFKFMELSELRDINKEKKKMFSFFLLGVPLIFLGVLLEKVLHDSVLFAFLAEGLFLGGWIMCWEGLSKILFDLQDLKRQIRHYRRFKEANIQFSYQ